MESQSDNDLTSKQPLRVGLTGGIGSGKSTVADLFAKRGVPVIDADAISHQIVKTGLPAHAEIVSLFGREILLPDGSIDRAKLRTRVFASPEDKKRLEAILHPRIREEMARRCRALTTPYCLMVIPLLVETGLDADVDRVLVVDTTRENQIDRVRARSRLDPEETARIMAAQVSRERRLAYADEVIENNEDLDRLDQQVTRLHQRYLALAAAR